MPVETPVDDTNTATAPADGYAQFLASREAELNGTSALSKIVAPAEVVEPITPAAEVQPSAVVAPDAVLDPDTNLPVENPTRNDRRIANLWKREQAAKAEVTRLLALLETRNAAPPLVNPQTAGRPDAQALTPDQQLTAAAKARLRQEPDEGEIGAGKAYPTYEAFVKDCAIYGGELAVEKRVILDAHATAATTASNNQQRAAMHYAEQSKLYPDFAEKMASSRDLHLGPVITDVLINTPDLSGHLSYWAATHAADVARINTLPHGAQLLEMGKVLAGFSASVPQAEVKPKPTSRAPTPTPTIDRPSGQVASATMGDAKSVLEFAAARGKPIIVRPRRH